MALQQNRHVPLGELSALGTERAAAQMHDERIVAENVAKPGTAGAHAKIILLAVAQPENRIEDADRVDQRPPDIEAESHSCGQVRVRRHGGLLEREDHRLGVALRWPWIILTKARPRTYLGVVGKWRYGADGRIRLRAARELEQAAVPSYPDLPT